MPAPESSSGIDSSPLESAQSTVSRINQNLLELQSHDILLVSGRTAHSHVTVEGADIRLDDFHFFLAPSLQHPLFTDIQSAIMSAQSFELARLLDACVASIIPVLTLPPQNIQYAINANTTSTNCIVPGFSYKVPLLTVTFPPSQVHLREPSLDALRVAEAIASRRQADEMVIHQSVSVHLLPNEALALQKLRLITFGSPLEGNKERGFRDS